MTAPAVSAARFGWACLLGLGLGLCYDFLRPLRPRRTALADSIFLAAALMAMLWFSFQICGGDIRPGAASGMLIGGIFYVSLPGALLRPFFVKFWKTLEQVWDFCVLPAKKILEFAKNMFASAKKWVTIRWNNRRHNRRISGGEPHDPERSFPDSDSQEQSRYQDRGLSGYRVVYPGPGGPAVGPE